jgi:hypothetical protein
MPYIRTIGEQLPYDGAVVGRTMIVLVSVAKSRITLTRLTSPSPGPTLLCIALLGKYGDVPEGS